MNRQQLLSYIRRAIDDYHMIAENDKIAVGLSGGKDSISLLLALRDLQRFYPMKFDLCAITVSLGFDGSDFSPMTDLCQRIGVPYSIVKTDIGKIVFDERKEKNPCSLCAKMRKGALHDEAVRLQANKVALGHNKDDTIETFFLSLLYEGRIHTYSPVTYLDRKKITSIRPMVYVPEADIRNFVKKEQLPIVKNLCTVDGYTKRQAMKEQIASLNLEYDHFDQKVFGAIQRSIWS